MFIHFLHPFLHCIQSRTVEHAPTLQVLNPNLSIQREQGSRRHLQQVSTIATRQDVVAWMIEDGGKEGLFIRTMDAFSNVFRSPSRNTNLVKAS